jgi:hypothetical protein
MNKFILTSLLLLGSAALSTQSLSAKTNTDVTTASHNVGDFIELRVNGALNVDYVCQPDSAGMVVITAPRNQVNWVEAQNKKGKLTLSLSIPDDVLSTPATLPSVRVYSNFLNRVENQGDSTVRVLIATAVPDFTAKVMGNGKVVVRSIRATNLNCTLLTGHGQIVAYGTATNASYSLAGTGVIQADEVAVTNATVNCTGTGTVGVNASEKLTVSGMGSGTVYYSGKPEITKKMSLGVKIKSIDNAE